MVKTGETSADSNSSQDWDSLANGPEVETAEPVKDAEYYRNNLSQINELSSRYSNLLGEDARSRSKRDATTGELIDENGLPLFVHHLNRYLRKNPDQIDKVVALCGLMEGDSGSDDELVDVESEVTELGGVEPGDVEPEGVEPEEDFVDNIIEFPTPASKEKGIEWSAGSFYINGYEGMTSDERFDAIDAGLDGINSFESQTSLSNALEKTIADCDDESKTLISAMRAKNMVEFTKQWLSEYEKQLKAVTPSMPWTENGKKAAVLKSTIASTRKSLDYYQKEADLITALAPEKPSDNAKRLVEKVKAIDEKRGVINEALHVRSLPREIKTYGDWIKFQEDYMKRDTEQYGGKEKASYPARLERIKGWRQDIENRKKSIADFQRRYPNFVLEPSKDGTDVLFAKPATAPAAAEEKKAA